MAPSNVGAKTMPRTPCPYEQALVSSSRTSKSSTGTGKKVRLAGALSWAGEMKASGAR